MAGPPPSEEDKSLPLPSLPHPHPSDVPPAYSAAHTPPAHFPHIGIPLSSIPTTASYARPPSDHPEHQAPPGYGTSLPASFPIGNKSTPPLVSVGELEAHLRILGAFAQRRSLVVSSPNWPTYLGEEARWTAYVARSVQRFEAWYTGVVAREGRMVGPLGEGELMPLDVGMVWHAYCLNPRTYYEDSLTRLPPLLKLGAFPLSRLSASIDPSSLLPLDPQPDTQAYFEHLTGLPWAPGLAIPEEEKARVACPACETVLDMAWYTAQHTGFSQPQFTALCPSCSLSFNKETLGVRRLCEQLAKWLQDPGNTFLAGTLLEPVGGMPNWEKGLSFNRRVWNWFSAVCKGKTPRELGEIVGWNILKVELCCRTGMSMLSSAPTPPRVRRVLSHYRHPGPFSLDLVGATLRQHTFVLTLHSLNWTSPAHLALSPTPLLRALARFHAWLDLLSLHPSAFYVPTLDIDLVWHTLMLSPGRYRSRMGALVGRVVEHEDRVEEGVLGEGFEATGRAWKARFGVPYSYCGCAPPPTSGVKLQSSLSSLRQKVLPLSVSRNNTGNGSANGNLANGTSANGSSGSARPKRTDLASPSDLDGEASLSHASTHNSILVLSNAQAAKSRLEREQDVQKRQEQLRRAAAKGKGDEWDDVLARRNGAHEEAFFAPLPQEGGEGEGKEFSYLPWILDGSSLAGGNCAAGLSGGLCAAGGGKGFCGNLGNTWGGKIANSMNNTG